MSRKAKKIPLKELLTRNITEKFANAPAKLSYLGMQLLLNNYKSLLQRINKPTMVKINTTSQIMDFVNYAVNECKIHSLNNSDLNSFVLFPITIYHAPFLLVNK